MHPRLIATDVDGTLLRSDGSLSGRTVDALANAQAAGWQVVPVSGRHPYSIRPVVEGTPFFGWCVGSNGAVAMDLRTEAVLFERTLDEDVQREFVARMRRRVPGVRCASIRDAGRVFVPEIGYTDLMVPGDHGRVSTELPEFPLEEVVCGPSLKLVLRHRQVGPQELLAVAWEVDLPGVHPSISGAPFLEVAPGGVTKASGMQRMADHLGHRREDVLAFGDNLNDLELLTWAGTGVAMGNALPELVAVADQVTRTNDEDGLAVVVERLLAEAHLRPHLGHRAAPATRRPGKNDTT